MLVTCVGILVSDILAADLPKLLEGEAAGAASVTAVETTTGVNRENVNKLLRNQGSNILKSALSSTMRKV